MNDMDICMFMCVRVCVASTYTLQSVKCKLVVTLRTPLAAPPQSYWGATSSGSIAMRYYRHKKEHKFHLLF